MGFRHETVMLREVVAHLCPRAGGRYVDATLGGGGHAAAILEASAPDGQLLGVDRDPEAIAAARVRLAPFGERVTLVCDRYGRLPEVLRRTGYGAEGPDGAYCVDGLVLDAGVSSHQLDTAERGFSFANDGLLDMRMGADGPTCAQLLDRLDEPALAELLRRFGEVPDARRIAAAILRERRAGRLERTSQLAELVVALTPAKLRARSRTHPATRVFQALRIAVNEELADLEQVTDALPDVLCDGGVAAIISFHSLEDRIVKRALRRHEEGDRVPAGVPLRADQTTSGPLEVVTRQPLLPSDEEIAHNPRARSAKLRVARRRRRAA